MTPLASSGRYSLLAVVGAGFVVAAPLATWLAVGAVTSPSSAVTLTLDVPSADATVDVVPPGDAVEPALREDDLHQLAQHGRVVPAYEGGKLIGVKLFAIRPDSLYARAGLQNGDVVTRVNGLALASPDAVMTAYESVRTSRVVVVDFLRRGERGTLTHSLPASE